METKEIIHYENKSLEFLCNKINTDLLNFSNLTNIRFVSKNKPDFVVKPIEIDITDSLLPLHEIKNLMPSAIETNVTIFIVYNITQVEEDKVLNTISLFELLTTGEMIAKENQVDEKNKWTIDSNEWSLVETVEQVKIEEENQI